jgi:hypothetical protein
MDTDLVAAEHTFFFYYAFVKSKKRVRLQTGERDRIVYCALHKIYKAPVFDVEELNDETLVRSSRKPLASFDRKDFGLFTTYH